MSSTTRARRCGRRCQQAEGAPVTRLRTLPLGRRRRLGRSAVVAVVAVTALAACGGGDGGGGGGTVNAAGGPCNTPGVTQNEVKVAIAAPLSGPVALTFTGYKE